jgi:hypothetical protein
MSYEMGIIVLALVVGFIAGMGWGYSAGLQRQIDGPDRSKGGRRGNS